jgi:5-methylcytosine-specific restriction endonuclease McrA
MKKKRTLSEETKKKIGLSNKGKNTWSKGRKLTEAHKKKLSLAKIGRKRKPHSLETRRHWSLIRTGKRHSEATRRKMRETHLKRVAEGKHNNYKGGITPINAAIRGSLEYKLWRRAILERDKYTCIWCGNTNNLQADHIKPFSLFPELRFALDNGRTLCKECHIKTDTYRGKMFHYKKLLGIK